MLYLLKKLNDNSNLNGAFMLDFIFIIGTSGIGKTTLSKGLFEYYKTVILEQNMVPEFISRDGIEDMTGELEERTCYENTKAMALCFHNLGYKNVVVTDLDDLRTADIPIDFRNYKFITLKLICSDIVQLQNQMKNRPNGGLIDYDLQKKCNDKVMGRPLLPNECIIDITGKDEETVLKEAISILQNAVPVSDYNYTKPEKELFYSWVFSNGLR